MNDVRKGNDSNESSEFWGKSVIQPRCRRGHPTLVSVLLLLCAVGCGAEGKRRGDQGGQTSGPVSLDTQADLSHEHKHLHGDPHRHDHEHPDGFTGAHAHSHDHGHRHAPAPHGGRILSLKVLAAESENPQTEPAEMESDSPPNEADRSLSRPHLELLATANGRIVLFIIEENREGDFQVWTPTTGSDRATVSLRLHDEPGDGETLVLQAQLMKTGGGFLTEPPSSKPLGLEGTLPEIGRVDLSVGKHRWASDDRWTLNLPEWQVPDGLDGGVE